VKEKLVSNGYRDYRDLTQDWETLRTYFKEHAIGPAKHEVAERFLGSKFMEDSEEFNFQIKTHFEK